MTPAQHDPERDLNRTLSRQADRFAQHANPLELDAVLSRAGEIRRGRRMRATMVMAAVVLAVAVPVGITTLGENDPTKPQEPGIAAAPKDDSPITLGGYNTGSAPRNGYVLDGTLRYAGQQTQVGDVSYLVRLNGGFLVGAAEKISFVPDEGEAPDETWTLGDGIVASADRNIGAFTEPDGTVVAVQDAGSRFFDVGKLPAGNTYRTVGVTGENCSGRSEEVGCTIWVTEVDETPATWKVSPNVAPEKVSGYDGLVAIDGSGNYVRQLAYDDTEGGTYGLFDAAGTQVWTTSDYAPKSFSPDGKHLIAGPAYASGFGDGSLTVLDAATGQAKLDLKVATTEDEAQVAVVQVVWEDDTHVLAAVSQGLSTAAVRFDLDGNRTYALPLQRVEDPYGPPPFKLG